MTRASAGSPVRAAYLEALGIDRWVVRQEPAAMPTVVASPVPKRAGPPLQAAPASVSPEAVQRAVQTTDWPGLREQVAACMRCEISRTRTQTVFGVGNLQAQWLVVGEAPGAEEDRRGEPFVGRAGQLLDAMLLAIGLPRETVFIANMLKCRPPANRDPSPAELAQCLPHLHAQIALLEPKIMLVVGRIAAQTLLGTDAPLARLRGRLHRFGAANTPLVVTYHPAYLLRSPADKRKAWEDLKLARSTWQRAVAGQEP